MTETSTPNLQEPVSELMAIDAALGAAVVDVATGALLHSMGSTIEFAPTAEAAARMARAKVDALGAMAEGEVLQDIHVTLGGRHHIFCLSASGRELVHAVLDKSRANLAVARRKVQEVAGTLSR